jgi:hypothetical protein
MNKLSDKLRIPTTMKKAPNEIIYPIDKKVNYEDNKFRNSEITENKQNNTTSQQSKKPNINLNPEACSDFKLNTKQNIISGKNNSLLSNKNTENVNGLNNNINIHIINNKEPIKIGTDNLLKNNHELENKTKNSIGFSNNNIKPTYNLVQTNNLQFNMKFSSEKAKKLPPNHMNSNSSVSQFYIKNEVISPSKNVAKRASSIKPEDNISSPINPRDPFNLKNSMKSFVNNEMDLSKRPISSKPKDHGQNSIITTNYLKDFINSENIGLKKDSTTVNSLSTLKNMPTFTKFPVNTKDILLNNIKIVADPNKPISSKNSQNKKITFVPTINSNNHNINMGITTFTNIVANSQNKLINIKKEIGNTNTNQRFSLEKYKKKY